MRFFYSNFCILHQFSQKEIQFCGTYFIQFLTSWNISKHQISYKFGPKELNMALFHTCFIQISLDQLCDPDFRGFWSLFYTGLSWPTLSPFLSRYSRVGGVSYRFLLTNYWSLPPPIYKVWGVFILYWSLLSNPYFLPT